MSDLDILKKICEKLKIDINKSYYEVNEQNKIIYLDLSNNRLTEIPAEIGQLQSLQELNLFHNQLTKIPAEIGQLQSLQKFNLLHNQLTKIPAEIGQLRSLQKLNLSYNQLNELPAEISQLRNLQELKLEVNSLTKPPPNIVKQGIEAIRNYFKDLNEQGSEYVYEAKLILVGEPGAGKTSLTEKFLNPDYILNPAEPMTKGIDIKPWKFTYKENIPFTIHIWDFGGQEIMHATHRYFLTKRSLYIVLADNRKEDTDFYYWLHMVGLFSGKSPVYIVLNEKHNYKKSVPDDIVKTFPYVADTFKINLSSNKGLHDLSAEIKKAITLLPHVEKEPIPKKWIRIREELESIKKDYIHLKEYIEICEKLEIHDEKKAFFISAFLHDIGAILHFQEDSLLKNCVILNPHWATEAVYLILFDEKVIDQAGEFSMSDVERIWKDVRYKYNHEDLLRLMKNFELCYEIKESKKYIIPELLPDKTSKDGYPEGFEAPEKAEILHFEYRYNFIPKGLISRLIVRMHTYIFKKLQWKYGVVLEYDNTFAEIREQRNDRKLKIRIYREHKIELLAIIRHQIDDINMSFENIDVKTMIPCVCPECKKSGDPYFYDFSVIQKCQAIGRKTVFCEKSQNLSDVKVDDLLRGVTMQKWDVFISYSSKDYAIIQKIIYDFKLNNISYWLDREQIKPGDFIIPKITVGLENSRYIIPCFSQNQIDSGWSQAEYESILYEIFSDKQSERKVIPLVIDDINKLPRLMINIKYTKYSDSNAYNELIEFLKK